MKHLLCALALALASVASADIPLIGIEEAAEISSINLTLPASATGAALFQACDRCKPVSVRAADTTIYYLNGQKVTLDALRAALVRQSASVVVFYDERNMTLTRVKARSNP
jgi:hypothetical protein